MDPLLTVHVVAGTIAILAGAAALAAPKGGRMHRAAGTAFFVAMLVMASLGVVLAVLLPEGTLLPKTATIVVGVFTLDLVATAWVTVVRKAGEIGQFEVVSCAVAFCAAAVLLVFGLQAVFAPHRTVAAPYFVFAAVAAHAGGLDLRVVRRGGVAGGQRIARHLWRMCLALFFATSFFFIGQQKVMPAALHGSPLLLALGLAPLGFMLFWLARTWLISRARPIRGARRSGAAAVASS